MIAVWRGALCTASPSMPLHPLPPITAALAHDPPPPRPPVPVVRHTGGLRDTVFDVDFDKVGGGHTCTGSAEVAPAAARGSATAEPQPDALLSSASAAASRLHRAGAQQPTNATAQPLSPPGRQTPAALTTPSTAPWTPSTTTAPGSGACSRASWRWIGAGTARRSPTSTSTTRRSSSEARGDAGEAGGQAARRPGGQPIDYHDGTWISGSTLSSRGPSAGGQQLAVLGTYKW